MQRLRTDTVVPWQFSQTQVVRSPVAVLIALPHFSDDGVDARQAG